MAQATAASFVECLSQLLDGLSREELTRLERQSSSPREFVQELIRRGDLTTYQASRVLQGRTAELLLGQYVILEQIGEGGMGKVYKARQRNLGRLVALKVIRKECLDNPRVISRFEREIRAAGQLSHPHIVRAYDAELAGSVHFIAMEYIDGVDLARLLKQLGPLAIDQTCDYMRQAALGLQHAHEQGMIHRDIKPANLLVTRKRQSSGMLPRPDLNQSAGRRLPPSRWGTLKILDLGLARWQDPETGQGSTHLTMMGTVMGTPDFISPEQARNSHGCDIRSDLYSLGCTFYYLLAGRIPFPNGNLTERLLQHQLDEPEPIAAVRRIHLAAYLRARGLTKTTRKMLLVPDSVAAVVKKLMAKRPEDRYQTPAELASALDQILDGMNRPQYLDFEPEPEPEELTAPGPVAAMSVPAVGFAAGQDDPTVQERPPTTTPAVQRATSPRRRRWWIWGTAAAALLVIMLGALGGGARKHGQDQPKTAEVKKIAADTAWQALQEAAEQKSLPIEQLRDKLLAFRREHPGMGRDVALLLSKLASPFDGFERGKLDGKQLFAWMPKELVGILGMPRGLQGWRTPACVAVSPDGRHIVSGGDDRVLRLFETASGPLPHRIDNPGSRVVRAAFSPDGKYLAAACDDGARIFDVAGRTLLHNLELHQGPVRGVAFHPEGNLLATAGLDGVVRLWDVAGGRLRSEIETNADKILTLAFDRAGDHILWGGLNHEVHWAQTDGRTAETWKFARCTAPVKVIAFHPEGRSLVVGGGDHVLRLCAWEGRQIVEKRRLDKHDKPVHDAAFSPDGEWLVSVGEDARVLVWHAATGELHKEWTLRAPIHGVAFAPDSRHFLIANATGTLFVFRLGVGVDAAAR